MKPPDHSRSSTSNLAFPGATRHLFPVCLTLVLATALLAQFGHLVAFSDSPFARYPMLDEAMYDSWAREVAGGDLLGKGAFMAMPAYPYFVGLLYALFGTNIIVPLIAHCLLGAVTASLVFVVGARTVSLGAGVAAGIMTAVNAPYLFLGSRLLSENLALAVNTGLLLYALTVFERENARGYGLLGLLTGMAALVRVQMLLFAVLTTVFIINRWKAASWKPAGLFLAGTFAVILPVTARNLYVTGEPTLISANGGINFMIGNHPGATGLFQPPPYLRSGRKEMYEDSRTEAGKRSGRTMSDREVDAFWYAETLRSIASRPLGWSVTMAKKFAYFWNGREIAEMLDYYESRRYSAWLYSPIDFRLLGVLGALGLIVGFSRRQQMIPLYIYMMSQIAFTMIFFVHSRFRILVLPALAVFAALGGEWTVTTVRQRRLKSLAGGLGIMAVASLLIFAPLPSWLEKNSPSAMDLHNTALAYGNQGDLQKAEEFHRQALALKPNLAVAHYEIGRILQGRGDFDGALQEFQTAVSVRPRFAEAHGMMGFIYFKEKNDPPRAEEAFRAAIAANPRLVAAYVDLGRVLVAQGRTAEAEEVLRRAVQIDPGLLETLSGQRSPVKNPEASPR